MEIDETPVLVVLREGGASVITAKIVFTGSSARADDDKRGQRECGTYT